MASGSQLWSSQSSDLLTFMDFRHFYGHVEKILFAEFILNTKYFSQLTVYYKSLIQAQRIILTRKFPFGSLYRECLFFLPNIDLEPLETRFQYNLLDTSVALSPRLHFQTHQSKLLIKQLCVLYDRLTGEFCQPRGCHCHWTQRRENSKSVDLFFPVNSEKYSGAHIYSKYQYVLLKFVKLSTNLPPRTG